jgi:hypothetical protein
MGCFDFEDSLEWRPDHSPVLQRQTRLHPWRYLLIMHAGVRGRNPQGR